MRYAYRGTRQRMDLVFRDGTSVVVDPDQEIDAPHPVNNISFEPLDAEARTAYAEFLRDWGIDESPHADRTPAAAAPGGDA